MRRLGISLLCALLPLGSICAQVVTPPQFLLPLTPSTTAGAYGTQWVVEAYLHNQGTSPIWVSDGYECPLSAVHACDAYLIPGVTAKLLGPFEQNAYYFVSEGDPAALTITAHVRNVSDGVDPWGTAVPVPSVSSFFASRLRLGPVPSPASHRLSFRAYTWPFALPSLSVEIWGVDSDTLSPTVRLATVTATPTNPAFTAGGVYELHDLSAIAGLATADLLEIRVTAPEATNLNRLWAFVSLTNNQTQHVTMFVP